MIAKTSTIVCVVLGVLFAGRVHAQPDPDSEAKPSEGAPSDGADQLTLPKGRALLSGYVEINLSSDAVFKPFSISPDVWYGATDDITVGLVHSTPGVTGFIGPAGTSLCLAGSSNGCGDVYPNAGLEARYKLKTGKIALAAGGGLHVLHTSDPVQLALKLGAAARWHEGKIAVEAAPSVFIGLTNRTPGAVGGVAAATNEEVFYLPGTVFYAVTPQISAAIQSGFVLPLQNTGDFYAIPLSLGGHYHVNESLDVNLAFSLPRLIAKSPNNAFDNRALTLGGTYAF
jgi:hypothetical protein